MEEAKIKFKNLQTTGSRVPIVFNDYLLFWLCCQISPFNGTGVAQTRVIRDVDESKSDFLKRIQSQTLQTSLEYLKRHWCPEEQIQDNKLIMHRQDYFKSCSGQLHTSLSMRHMINLSSEKYTKSL